MARWLAGVTAVIAFVLVSPASPSRAQNVKSFLAANGVKPHRVLIAKETKGHTLIGLLDDDHRNDLMATVTCE